MYFRASNSLATLNFVDSITLQEYFTEAQVLKYNFLLKLFIHNIFLDHGQIIHSNNRNISDFTASINVQALLLSLTKERCKHFLAILQTKPLKFKKVSKSYLVQVSSNIVISFQGSEASSWQKQLNWNSKKKYFNNRYYHYNLAILPIPHSLRLEQDLVFSSCQFNFFIIELVSRIF